MDNASSGQTGLSGRAPVCFNSDAICWAMNLHPHCQQAHANHLSNPNTKCDEKDNQTLSVVVRVHLRRVWDGSV